MCTCRWTKESPAPFVISAWSSSPFETGHAAASAGRRRAILWGRTPAYATACIDGGRAHRHVPRWRPRPTAHRSNLPDSALSRGRFWQPRSVTLHDELRELVDTFGQGLLGDADQFRAALDDYLPENAALPGQLNVLYDAVRFGAYARCVELLSRGSDPMLAVGTAGDLLARDRGTTEVVTSRWAVATLAHATGHLATDALSVFLQPDTAGGPLAGPRTVDPDSAPARHRGVRLLVRPRTTRRLNRSLHRPRSHRPPRIRCLRHRPTCRRSRQRRGRRPRGPPPSRRTSLPRRRYPHPRRPAPNPCRRTRPRRRPRPPSPRR